MRGRRSVTRVAAAILTTVGLVALAAGPGHAGSGDVGTSAESSDTTDLLVRIRGAEATFTPTNEDGSEGVLQLPDVRPRARVTLDDGTRRLPTATAIGILAIDESDPTNPMGDTVDAVISHDGRGTVVPVTLSNITYDDSVGFAATVSVEDEAGDPDLEDVATDGDDGLPAALSDVEVTAADDDVPVSGETLGATSGTKGYTIQLEIHGGGAFPDGTVLTVRPQSHSTCVADQTTNTYTAPFGSDPILPSPSFLATYGTGFCVGIASVSWSLGVQLPGASAYEIKYANVSMSWLAPATYITTCAPIRQLEPMGCSATYISNQDNTGEITISPS